MRNESAEDHRQRHRRPWFELPNTVNGIGNYLSCQIRMRTETPMIYTLMHKDIEVADLEINDDGYIVGIVRVRSTDHMPVGTTVDGRADIPALRSWGLDAPSRRAAPGSAI